MIIWVALIIPIITAIILYMWFDHKITCWEYTIPTVISIIVILVAKFTIEKVSVSDTEYWGGYVSQATYIEDWNEYVQETCSIKDDKGDVISYYDCSHVDYHPPRWSCTDSNYINLNISEQKYNEIKSILQNEQFHELNRHFYTNDGNMFTCSYDSNINHIIPVTTTHTYENRIQSSNSVYKFREINNKDHKLFDYPQTNPFDTPSILGGVYPEFQYKLNRFNALYGRKKQLRVWVLLYRNQDRQIGLLQEEYWKGGNKNEFVICLGLGDNNKLDWNHVFSWTSKKECVIETRDYLTENIEQATPENLSKFEDWLETELIAKFKRKEFKEFSYITIEPSLVSIFFTFLITILVNVGISFWAINNKYFDKWN